MNIISSNWRRCYRTLLTSAVITLIAINGWVAPAVTAPASEIAQKIAALKRQQTRWIQIDLKKQRLIAWDGKNPVHAVVISTGKDATPTLSGVFKIQSKHEKARMRGDNYDIPDVPYVMFYEGNYGIHGAYWHRSFGTPVSHGCVNVAVDHARWLFNWATVGTPVVVSR
ncbi:MAG TPA: L,D-transpeptidase [Candidatus Sericytochromatia bacterium]|jgi:lipoprotein-anchoring transpeptidase ErfK/SrfK